MNKNKKRLVNSVIALMALLPMTIFAVPEKPNGPGSNSNSTQVTYNGATTINDSETLEGKTYSSSSTSQNALLLSNGASTLTSCTVNKTGDSNDENADFYGNNAAILVYNGATLNLKKSTITTNGSHANAIFAYSNGIINVDNTKVITSSNNSGGLMVTGGGTLNATSCQVNTSGNSSAALRSDRGGGNLTVTKGSYTTTGVGSPAIYSTANIVVNDATLTSSASEGAIVEGANSITLNKVILTDNNTTLNGNSETYKNIFLYQSMSGDANEGNATFTATDSTITTKKGDSIFVTNTTAVINLTNDTFINTSGDFLRIQTSKWGTSGSNGGKVTLNTSNQKIDGNIIVDNISTLSINMKDKSIFKGSINNDQSAKKIDLYLSKDSTIVLTKDCYVNTLTNEKSDNLNIYLNNHKLYVNGKEVTANTTTYKENNNSTKTNTVKKATNKKVNNNIYIEIGLLAIIIIGIIIVIIFKNKNHKEDTKKAN